MITKAISAVALALTLAGCSATIPVVPVAPITPVNPAPSPGIFTPAQVAQIKADIAKICGYQASVAEINNVIATMDPQLLVAANAVNSIEAAFCGSPLMRAKGVRRIHTK
jgi:hypothetical protein